jgi:hypothetical protein
MIEDNIIDLLTDWELFMKTQIMKTPIMKIKSVGSSAPRYWLTKSYFIAVGLFLSSCKFEVEVETDCRRDSASRICDGNIKKIVLDDQTNDKVLKSSRSNLLITSESGDLNGFSLLIPANSFVPPLSIKVSLEPQSTTSLSASSPTTSLSSDSPATNQALILKIATDKKITSPMRLRMPDIIMKDANPQTLKSLILRTVDTQNKASTLVIDAEKKTKAKKKSKSKDKSENSFDIRTLYFMANDVGIFWPELDLSRPNVTLSTSAASITAQSPIPFAATWSEPVADFAAADIVATGGLVGNFKQTDGHVYSFEVTPNQNGTIVVSIPESVATDLVSHPSNASNSITIQYSSNRPTATLTSSAPSTSNASSFRVAINFSESVTGFTIQDLAVSGATLGGFSGSAASFEVDMYPTVDGTVTLQVNQDAAIGSLGIGNSISNLLSRTSDKIAPQVTAVSVNLGAATTLTSNTVISINATDTAPGKVAYICAKFLDSNAPSASDSCWTHVSAHPLNQSPATAFSTSSFNFRLGLIAATYTTYLFVKDEAGNVSQLSASGVGTLGVDKDSINLTPGTPPVIHKLLASNTVNQSTLPAPTVETTFTAGQNVIVKWRVTDASAIPAGGISLYYTNDDLTYSIVASGLNNVSNGGCTVNSPGTSLDNDATGCFVWTGAPSTNYFAMQLRVTDVDGFTSLASSEPLNSGGLRVIAGAMDPGIGGSASAAVFFSTIAQPVMPDGNNLLVASDGTIYFRDWERGLLKIRPDTGLLEVFLPRTGTSTGDGGLLSAATANRVFAIAFDSQERVIFMDSERIRRINTNLNPPTIETIIGGGSSLAETDLATNIRIPVDLNHADRGNAIFLGTADGKIYFQTGTHYGTVINAFRIQVYDPTTQLVSSVRFTGNGTTSSESVVVSDCVGVANVGMRFNKASGEVLTYTHNFYETWNGCGAHWVSSATFNPAGISITPRMPVDGRVYRFVTGLDGNIYSASGRGIGRYNPATNSWDSILGDPTQGGLCTDGTAALSCRMTAASFFVDKLGSVYFVEQGKIRKLAEDGTVVTVAGVGFSSGDGGMPTSARFASIRNLEQTNSGEIVVLDPPNNRIRSITPGVTVSTIAGDGNFGDPDSINPANTQSIGGYVFGDDRGMGVDKATGDVFFSQGYLVSRLVRSLGTWQTVAGGGATLYSSGDGLVGTDTFVNMYGANILGFANNKVATIAGSYNVGTTTHYDQFIKLYDTTDSGRQIHLLGKYANLEASLCVDGTATNNCPAPLQVYPRISEPSYNSFTSRWLLHLIGEGAIRSIPEGTGTVQTLVNLPRTAQSFAYYRTADLSTNIVYYCDSTDRKLRSYDLNTSTDTALSWPNSTIRCHGYSLKYDAIGHKLIFPIIQNQLSGVGEWKL